MVTPPDTTHTVLVGLKRGARGRCPNCGRGKLFRAYLKIRPTCEVCGQDNANTLPTTPHPISRS